MADSALSESLAALSRFFVGEGTLAETLQRVSGLTVQAVPPADLVGITLLVEGRQRTAIFTDEMAPEIDQAQYDTGEGPCLHAFHTQEVVGIDSTSEPPPWPAFRQAAADHGIRSTLSLPMVVDNRGVGALNLYSRAERAFSDQDRQIALQFSAQAAIVLANAQAYWDAREMNLRLGQMMESRGVIEQAKGIIMAAQHCDPDTAFDVLVRASQRENLKLRDLAARLVQRAIAGEGGDAQAGPSQPGPPSGH